ncbi:MAG: transcriptional repressor [Candidatus Dormibacteraeota bacterium]|nr:transcriptional repressor [Candidatus Dormibacteraeota bacterium]
MPTPAPPRVATDLQGRLRRAGLRVTRARLAVLEAAAAQGHHDVDTIGRRAGTSAGSISIQSVYDNLNALESAGLVRRIQPAGAPAHYEARVGDNHHHVVCRRCGATGDVDCAVGETPCLEPSSSEGYLIDEAEVTYWGLCPGCQLQHRGTASTRHQGNTV